jgi:SAM-dependent methyltransferase
MFGQHSLLRGLEMGSPEWFAAQRRMLEIKPAVARCYRLWYDLLLRDLDSTPADGRVAVEIGSGSSFLHELRPGIITSDIVPGNVDLVVDGRELPFADGSLRALFLTHVFHHIPDVERFLREADRVLVPGGVVSIVDETHTPFARFFFDKIHPEPYNDAASEWSFPPGHTMLDSNQALAWMVFFRDRERFERVAPRLVFEQWRYLPWFAYLMSGGVNLNSLVPRPMAGLFEALDNGLKPLDRFFAIHWHLTLRKRAQ